MAKIQPIQRSQYRLLGMVGHGQFGQVYCAIHRKTGALVALKYLHKDRFPTHKLLRELRFLLSLEHPNIVTCHALEHAGGGRQLVLDYCESGTLRSILDSDIRLTLEEALGLVLDILAGLEHAHQQGIVHCDIKPENVLLQLTPGGWIARISDFGVARLSQDGRDSDIGPTGSPAYMAPERFYNQHPTASDLYAVGIILYELLLGKRPFSGTPLELMVAHLNQVPIIPDELPEPLKKITCMALQKLLPKRFQSAQAMRQALLQVHTQHQSGPLALGSLGGKILPPARPSPALPWLTIPHAIEVMGLAVLPTQAVGTSGEPNAGHQSKLLIAASQGNVWFYHWPNDGAMTSPGPTQGFTLPAPVKQFVPIPQGGMLVTATSLHLLSMTHGLGRIAQVADPVQTAIAPDGQWFATAQQTGSATVELLLRQLKSQPNEPIKISAASGVSIPTTAGEIVALLPLDADHVGLVMGQHQRTVFHLVTRRGTYEGSLSVSVAIANLVATTRPYRYLGLEVNCPQSLLIIDLKPFRVMRYRADISPKWLFGSAFGYGLLSQEGQFSLMNDAGQITHRLTNLPCPTAMVQVSPSQFLWSVPDPEGSRLYTMDFAAMGLAIDEY